MGYTGLPLYYYPTTVLLLDDSEDFLTNFSLQLQNKLAVKLYSRPQSALAYLKNLDDSSHVSYRVFSNAQDNGGANPVTNHTVNLNLSSIKDEIYNPKRFAEVAVVIIDYDMHSLNGLEFCRKLGNTPIKRILLTGKADEKIAVQAFNEGLIDHFIQKSNRDVIALVEENIERLQRQYFEDTSNDIRFMLSKQAAPFVNDPIFIEFFQDICKKNDIVEYYLAEITGSFLLLDANANASWLVVKCYEDLSIHYEFAQDNNAPDHVLAEIRSGNKIPFAWNADDYFQFKTKEEWEAHVYPADEIKGKDVYYYALIKDPYNNGVDKKRVYNYRQYVSQLLSEHVINH